MSNRVTSVIVHLAGAADSKECAGIEKTIAAQPGVDRARLSPKIERMLLVDYDPAATSAQHILDAVQNRGVSARLVGI